MSHIVYDTGSALCYLFGKTWLRLRYVGDENLPSTGAVILLANHCSLLDPPMLGCGLPRRVRYMAKSNLRRVPLMGRLIASLGVLFVERSGGARAGLELGISALQKGEVLGVFPEGTRGSGQSVNRFKRGILLILQRLVEAGQEVAIVPAGIRGTARALPKGAWFPRPHRVEVHYGRPLTAEELLQDRDLQRLHRRVSILAGLGPGAGGDPGSDRRESAGDKASPDAKPVGRDQDDSLTSNFR